MTTTVDLVALAAAGQTKVTLLGGTITSIGSTGTDYAGFDNASSVYVEVQVQLRDNSRGAAQLTLLLEGSDDGLSWSTLETFSFSNNGTQTASVDTPNAHLRVSWTVARNTEWYIDHVTVAPALLNAPGGGGGSLPAEWTVGDDGDLTMSVPVGSGNNVAVLRIVDPNNPDTAVEIRLTDDGGSDETVLLSLAPSGDNEAKIQLVDDNSDGFVTLRTGDASVFQARTGTTGANPVLAVKVGGAAIFEVHADGSLHGKTGHSLAFDL